MKTKEELHKHLDWINQNLEGLTAKKLEVEKQLKEHEKPKFDFEKLMPLGSIWLGELNITNVNINNTRPVCLNGFWWPVIGSLKAIYHAHQIVKAAQKYVSKQGLLPGSFDLMVEAVKSAEADGVLQNLE